MKLLMTLAVAALGLVAINASAEIVTSTINGTIKYLPEVNSVVKKGQPLVKFSKSGIKIKIEVLKLKIKLAKEELKDKKSDIARSKKLYTKSAISLASHEDVIYEYHKCYIECMKLKLEMKDLERMLNKRTIIAPYECKVTKVLIVPNSGVELGQEILDVQKI
ncbi:MAG TPA: hypothetical protein QF753_04585 [Victivallales bacterium]|nr:hypothetical protein [Victivallales bacterium]